MGYCHRQNAPLHFILLAITLAMLVFALNIPEDGAKLTVLLVAVSCFLISLCFGHLVVRDDRDALSVRFGPLPLFGVRVPYAQIMAAEAARSTFLDGWGVHWMPGKGWIYNLWGRDCVRIHMGRKTVRVGTDDVAGLLAFLKTRVQH